MGNFTRRFLAFVLGMVVGLVSLFGGMAGAMYWAFKNLTLSKIGVVQEEDESGLKDATIEDLVALVIMAQTDPDSFTFKKLEEEGINLLKLISDMGVDFSKSDAIDYEKLKEVSPLMLFSSEGLNEISFSTIFAFLPKDEEGNYPVFSAGARNMLRGYSLGYLLETDVQTGQMRLFSELGSLKFGSLFPQTFVERYDEEKGEYVYTAENGATEKLGNLKISLLTNNLSGESTFNLGKELHEGELKEIGSSLLSDFLTDMIAGNDEVAREETKQSLMLLDGVYVKDLFKKKSEMEDNEAVEGEDGAENVEGVEDDEYMFDVEALFSGFSIGKLMGYAACTESETCPIHEGGVGCNGSWYEKCSNNEECPIHGATGCEGQETIYKEYVDESAEGLINKNLINLSMDELLEGKFEITTLVDGMFLGHSLGYSIATSDSGITIPEGYCYKDCETTLSHTEHTYYWIDKNNAYVGELYNKLSNIALENAVLGTVDMKGVVDTSLLGELLGKYNKDGAWYDDSNCTIPAKNKTAMDKIMLSIYDKTMQEISSGSGLKLEEILEGIKMGELMNYSYEDGVWYDKNGNVANLSKLDETIYVTEVSRLVKNEIGFKDVLKNLYVGDLMNYTGGVGTWEKNGEPVSNLNKTVADIQLSEIFGGDINFKERVDKLMLGDVIDVEKPDTPTILKILGKSKISELSQDVNDMELGEVMGYTKCTNDDACTVHDGGDGCDGKWYKNGGVVEGLNAKIANYTFKKFSTDGFNPNEFTLGDVITDDKEYDAKEGSIFSLLDVEDIEGTTKLEGANDLEKRKNIPINDVSKRTKSGVTKAKLKDLRQCGIFTLTPEDETKLDNAFDFAATNGKIDAEDADWQELTLNEFIAAVIKMLPTSAGG
ncbi:MAG: hypothetical protein IKV61_03420 [Clostridia bacterium]|nr:hypothetical protein [Clostridia bacterium]